MSPQDRMWTVAALACLAAAVATAQEAGTVATGDNGWELRSSPEGSTDRPTCTLVSKQNPSVEVGKDKLVVRVQSKNGLFNYQYRIDGGPPSTPEFPAAAMREAGAIALEGAAFDRVLAGRRLSIRILDRLHEAVVEEVNLDGLSALHAKMLAGCR